LKKLLYKSVKKLEKLTDREKVKEFFEISYWYLIKLTNRSITNYHYEEFYTKRFGLDKSFYNNKIIVDLGCGPRGSLDWADNAFLRIGIDPLALKFKRYIKNDILMPLIANYGESLALKTGSVEVVTSFNSLDHVNNLDSVINEIARILKKGGSFLLITNVGHKPTPTEPQSFSWDIIKKFKNNFDIISELHLEKTKSRAIYESIRRNVSYDHSNLKHRYGVLIASFQKK
jgi:SAM-dependent methyltransferase